MTRALDATKLSQLVGLIYDGAVDAAHWEAALSAICEAMNFQQSGLVAASVAFPGPMLDVIVGAEDRWRKLIPNYWQYLPIEWGAAFVNHRSTSRPC